MRVAIQKRWVASSEVAEGIVKGRWSGETEVGDVLMWKWGECVVYEYGEGKR